MDQPTIDIEIVDDVTVVSFVVYAISSVNGIEAVSEQIRAYIAENQPDKMVVDFSKVKFLSSQMLGLLVDVWRRLGVYGGHLVISGINPQLNRVFKITNLDKIFEFAADKDSAVEQIKQIQVNGGH